MLFPMPEDEGNNRKPGKEWTEDERKIVCEWLNTPPQLEENILLTLRYLWKRGAKASVEDAEDTWQDFCAPRLGRNTSVLDETMYRFDPQLGDFPKWLRSNLYNFCSNPGRRLRTRASREAPMDDLAPTRGPDEESEREYQFEDPDPENAHYRTTAAKEELARLFSLLDPREKDVLLMNLLEGKSHEEIAKELGITTGNSRIILFRALRKLRREGRDENHENE